MTDKTARYGQELAIMVIVFAGVLLCGCDNTKELLGGLDARQSIDITVALQQSQIVAQRVKTISGREERYRIDVPESDYLRALGVLSGYGLPKREERSIEDLTRQQGFTPLSPEINAVRLDYLLSIQVESALRQALDGVVDARAFIRSNLDLHRTAKSAERKPTASITIRYASPSGNLPFSENRAKEIAAKIVPGLLPDDILLSTSRVSVPGENNLFVPGNGNVKDLNNENSRWIQLKPFVFRVPREERLKALLQVILYLVLCCVFGAAAGYSWAEANIRRRFGKGLRQPAKNRAVKLEAVFEGQGPDDTGTYKPRRDTAKMKKPQAE